MIDYQVKLINFHNGKIKGCVSKNEDGSFTIFIEDNLSSMEKEKVLKHELHHICNDDFIKSNIHDIEMGAHGA